MKEIKMLFLASMVMLFTACGGGGSSSGVSTPPETSPPDSTTPDITAPVITVLGNNSETVIQGEVYIDAGATATDDNDGSVIVITTGNVDTLKVGEYIITYTATDSAGNTANATRNVNVVLAPDITAPIITLNGINPVTVTLGNTYLDLGATAQDDRDGSVAVITTGSVDTSKIGEYTLIYTATDSAGNIATKTRTVNVILASDNIAPVITVLGNNPETVMQGDTYLDDGATATDDRDGSLPITTSSTVNTAIVGTYAVTYTATDSAGNTATETRIVNVVPIPNTSPVADAGVDQKVYVSNIVTLDGSNSSDADNDDLTYSWSITGKPTGSGATLSSNTAINPMFIVDIEGTYVIELIVNDGKENSNADSVTVVSETDTRYDTVNYDEGIFQ